VFGLLRAIRRRQLRDRPVPAEWERIIAEDLEFASAFSADERARWLLHLKLFAWEKRFEGVGIDVTERMQVVVAGIAARLSRNLDVSVYDDLDSVVIYPHAVKVPRSVHDDGLVTESEVGALGLATGRGAVVLSWAAVEDGLADPDDGHDTALHEFAHVIDAADGAFDGTPALTSSRALRAWARVMSARFLELKSGGPIRRVLRDYGATNEAEFFAVASEVFFERPEALKARAPDLYRVLADFYRVDEPSPKSDDDELTPSR